MATKGEPKGGGQMPSLELVERSELFRGLSKEVLERILPFCRDSEYPRGAVIFEEGKPARHGYVLTHGLVTLRIDTPIGEESVMVTAIRDEGEVFGWSALIEPFTYTSTAVCLEPSKVIVLDAEKLMHLLDENPEAGFIVMKNAAAIVASRLGKARRALTAALAPGLISHG
jgi:CRP-like cAMP-binding protein